MATSMHTVAEVSEVAQPRKRRIIMPHAPFAQRLKTTSTKDTDGADLKPALSAESDLAGVTGSLRTTDANGLESSSAITDTTGTDMKDAVAATGYAVMATGPEETKGAVGDGQGSVDHAPFAKRLKTTSTEDTDGADLKPALSAEHDLAGVTGSLRTTEANGLNPSSVITDTTGTDMKDAVSATGYAVMATGLEETEGADGGGRGSVDMGRC
jgi:hypothetical protein